MPLTREMLERLTDRSTDIVVATDRKGRVVYYNDGASKSLGYSSDEILGQFVGDFYPSVDEARRVALAMRDPAQSGSVLCAFRAICDLRNDRIEINCALMMPPVL